MAIYHLSAKPPLCRAHGRSAVAAAAYRAGCRIVDSRTGLVHDYSRRRGVLGTGLVLPGGGAHPDQAAFWNSVERHHRRKDAVLARELVVALPVELEDDARARLTSQLAEAIADRYEVAVHWAVHSPSRMAVDDRNFHAHLLISCCKVDAAGALGNKAVELDPIHCQRAGIPDSVSWLRPRWQEMVNSALAQAGSSARVNCRSHRARGKLEVPSVHVGIGPGAKARRNRNAYRKEVNNELRRNAALASSLSDERRRLTKQSRLLRRAPVPRGRKLS